MASRQQIESYLSLPQVRAALDTIAWAEGANYNTLYGGGTFSGSQHPNRRITAGGYTSTAAGRYQFLYSTWASLGLPDMSPRNQDIGALVLMSRRGVLDYILRGDFEGGLKHGGLGREWASLPFSPYGQPKKTLAQTLNYFNAALRAVGGSVTVSNLPSADLGIDLDGNEYILMGGAALILLLLITE